MELLMAVVAMVPTARVWRLYLTRLHEVCEAAFDTNLP